MSHTAFVFDLDGTLLDTLPDLVTITNEALALEGFPPHTRAEILSYVGDGAKSLMAHAVPPNADPAAFDRALAYWKQSYADKGDVDTVPYKGIEQALADLKARGIALGVLSNKFDGGVKQLAQRFFPGVFAAANGECEAIPRKPDPTGLLFTIESLGAQPQDTVYVGDSPGDMITAQNAGCFALGVSWGYRSVDDLRASGAQAIISNPAQLLEHI